MHNADAVAVLADRIGKRRLTIFVPADMSPAAAAVAPGSASVGAAGVAGWPAPKGTTTVGYEGCTVGIGGGNPHARSFAERLKTAAGRQIERYPTITRPAFPTSSLVPVGYHDAALWRTEVVTDAAALDAWIREDGRLDPRELDDARADEGTDPVTSCEAVRRNMLGRPKQAPSDAAPHFLCAAARGASR